MVSVSRPKQQDYVEDKLQCYETASTSPSTVRDRMAVSLCPFLGGAVGIRRGQVKEAGASLLAGAAR